MSDESKKVYSIRISKIKPLLDDKEILDFIHSLNGDRKHDKAICDARGFPRFVGDVVRRVFGKSGDRIILDDDVKEKVLELYDDGVPVKEISRQTGRPTSSIYEIVRRYGESCQRNKPWSKIQTMRLMDARDNKKLTWAEIGKLLGKKGNCCFAKYKCEKAKEKENRKESEVA